MLRHCHDAIQHFPKFLTGATWAIRIPKITMSSPTKLSCLWVYDYCKTNQFRFKLEPIRGHPSTNRISTFTESLQLNLFRTNIQHGGGSQTPPNATSWNHSFGGLSKLASTKATRQHWVLYARQPTTSCSVGSQRVPVIHFIDFCHPTCPSIRSATKNSPIPDFRTNETASLRATI